MAKRWTKREAKQLLMGAGAFGVSWLQGQTGPAYEWPNAPQHRSYYAMKSKAHRMELGGFTRGSFSLDAVMCRTGYTRKQLFRAMAALNQKWKRTGPRGPYLVTDDQLDEIVEWLRHDFWCKSKHLYSCLWCSGEKRRHEGLGLCVSCFWKHLKLCLALGVPSGVKQQKELVAWLRTLELRTEERKFLERVTWRLGKGLALERGQLEWLSLLIPEVWHASRDPGQ